MAISRPIAFAVAGGIGGLAEGGAALETIGFDYFAQCARRRGGGEGVEAEKFCLGITRAVVWRGVGQSVRGHHAVETTAADPVIDVPVFCFGVDELNAGARGHQEIIRGLGDVTAVMKPIGVHVGRNLDHHFAGAQVASGEDAAVAPTGGWRAPHHPAHHEQIFRRLIAAARVGRFPKLLAGFGVDGFHRAIAAGVEHHAIVHHQLGAKVEAYRFGQKRLARAPRHVARGTIECHHFFAVVKKHAMLIGRHRQWRNFAVVPPNAFAGHRIVCLHVALFFVPCEVTPDARLVAGVMKRQKRIQLPLLRTFQNKNLAAFHDDFLRAFAAGQFVDELARGGIEHAHRFIDAERDENAILHRYQPPRQLRRPTLQRPQMTVPFFHRLLPKDDAVKRIARHERPARG